MKKILILSLAFCAALNVSCIEKVETSINHGVDMAALEPMTDYEVPIKPGYTTVVTLDGEQLAVTRAPLTISVPVRAATRSGGLEVSYSNEDIFGEFATASYWHYLSFEDTPEGDCDYNDIVLHCRVKSEMAWNPAGPRLCRHTVSVQPVALGGSVTVGFGFLYQDESGAVREHVVTDNIRRDLFDGIPSFPINTDLSKPTKKVSNILKPVFECSTSQTKFPVVWFIISNGKYLYAATTNFDADKNLNMINKDRVPYGFALTKKWCWPVENCNIREAYPHFDEWLRTGDETLLLSDPVRENIYAPAVVKVGADGDLWDYEK